MRGALIMAVYREDILNIDLISGTINRSFMNKSVGEGDIKANRFGVRVFRGGEEVDLSGVTVIGYFIRENGTTVVINGSRDYNTCWVDLPQACYAVEGQFTLSILLTDGTVATTARIVDGTVVNTTLGSIYDPGGVIPDLSSFTELVERAETAAETIEAFSVTATQITGTRYKIAVTIS